MNDAKEEALAAIATKFAEEEMRWRQENPGKVRFYLLRAPDEPPTFSKEGQSALGEIASALHENSIDADMPIMALDSADATGGLTGQIAVIIQALGPVMAGILGAWLQSKVGRKVRLKLGDFEAEASTVQEVEQLIQRAKELQTYQKSAKDETD